MENADIQDYQKRRDIGNIFDPKEQEQYQQRRSLDFEVETQYDHGKIKDLVMNYNIDQEINEDDAERMIKLYFASDLNKRTGDQRTPDQHDYEALVHSQFGDRAPMMKKAEVFKKMREMIVPEPDVEFKAWNDYRSLTNEEKWEKIKPDDAEAKSASNVSSFGIRVGSNIDAVEYNDEQKSAMIEQHERELRQKSPFLTKFMGKKFLSKRMQKLAFDLANGVKRETMAFEYASPVEKQLFFPYLRALNPDIDVTGLGGTISATWERMKQQEASDRESRHTALYSGNMFNDDLTLNLKMRESGIIDGYDFENGKWVGDDAKEMAQAYIDNERELSSIKEGFYGFDADEVDVDSPEFHERMQQGRASYENKKWSRAIIRMTQDQFDTNGSLIKDALIEGGAMTTYMLPMMASSVVGGAPLSMLMSGSEFYGRQFDDLVYDHGVDISDAQKNALITSIPYSMMEQMQVKFLAGLSKGNVEVGKKFVESFPKWLQSNGAKFAGDVAKGYSYEMSQEFAQAVIERMGRLYASEFQEAEGITFDGEMKSLVEEMKMASKAMILPAIGARMMRGSGVHGGAFASEQQAQNIDTLYHNIDVNLKEAKDIKSQLTPEVRVALNEAQTAEEQQQVLSDLTDGLTLDQVQQYDTMQSQIGEFVEEARTELRERGDLDEAQIDEMVTDQYIMNRFKMREHIKPLKYVDAKQTGVDTFVVRGKENGAEVNTVLVDDMKEGGSYDRGTNTLYLPKNAESIKFTHELTHAIADTGLINKEEFAQLLEYGNKLMAKQGVSGFADAGEIKSHYQEHYNKIAEDKGEKPYEMTDADVDHEIVAMALEEVRKADGFIEIDEGMRAKLKKVWDRIASFFKYITASQQERQLVQDVFEGKPMMGGTDLDTSTPSDGKRYSFDVKGDEILTPGKKYTTDNKADFEGMNERLDTPLDIIDDFMAMFDGIPFITTISDQLASGDVINPHTGNSIRVNGGIGFNGTDGNFELAWANTTEDEAGLMHKNAMSLYNSNKELFDKLWEQGRLPKGQIPMLVVKMGADSIKSNEALFRMASDVWSKIPGYATKKAFTALKKDLNKLHKDAWDKKYKEHIEKAKKNKKIKRRPKEDFQNTDFRVANEYVNSKDNIFEMLDNITEISIGNRAVITDRLFGGSVNVAGESAKTPSVANDAKAPVKALASDNKGNLVKDRFKMVNLGYISDLITEQAIKDIPPYHIIGVQGVNVLDGGVADANHKNYPKGVKGSSIGVLRQPIHVGDAISEVYANSLVQVINKAEIQEKKFTETQALSQAIMIAGNMPDKIYSGARIGSPDEMSQARAFINASFPTAIITASDVDWDAIEVKDRSYIVANDNYKIDENGQVYINPDIKNSDESLEFAGHLWIDFIRNKKPDIYNKGIELIEGTEYDTSNIEDEVLSKEDALARAIADKGAKIKDEAKREGLKNWILGMWKYIQTKFKSLQSYKTEEIADISLKEFIEGALADIYAGQKITKPRFSLAPPTDSKAFKDWFGDSKVVNEDGSPKVVYHGTNEDFYAFDPEKLGDKNWLAESASLGFFFAGSKETAKNYTGMNAMDQMGLQLSGSKITEEVRSIYADEIDKVDSLDNEIREGIKDDFINSPKIKEAKDKLSKFMSKEDIDSMANMNNSTFFRIAFDGKEWFDVFSERSEKAGLEKMREDLNNKMRDEIEVEWAKEKGLTPHIKELYLSIQNPLVVDADGKVAGSEFQITNHIKDAKEKGHDGVIFENMIDGGAVVDTIYIAFSPTQIKSATDNVGTFDPANADIRYSLDIAKDSKLDYKTSEGTLPDGRGFTDIEQFYDGELSRRIRLIVEDGNILPETAMYVRGEWWTDKKTLASFNLPLNPVDNVKGSGTDLYLRAMELVKENGGSWESDTDMQPEVIDLYERLMDFGLPIERLDVDDETSFLISQEDMQEIDFKEVRKNLNEVYSGKGGIRYSLENTVADIRAEKISDIPSEDRKISWEDAPEGRGDSAIINRNEKVKQGAQDLFDGKITNEDFRAIVDENSPIKEITTFFNPATDEQIKNALSENKAKDINKEVNDGTKVGLRLDIPAYLNANTWVVSIHDGTKKSGSILSYQNSAHAENISFETVPRAGLGIALGKTKSTIARMHGDWINLDGKTTKQKGESAKKLIEDAIKDPAWVQVGMNPFRASYFYDRANGQPVVSADELIQVGGLVYAKNVEYASKDDVRFEVKGKQDASGQPVRFSLDPLPQERKLAVIALADRMLKGNLTDQKADEIMQAFGIEDREAVMADAQLVIDDMDDDIKKATNKNTLKKAIRTKANQLEYRQRLRDIQMSAREGGEIYERARQAIAKRKKLAREMDIQDLDEATISNIIGDFRSSILEDEPNTTGMDMVSEAIRRKMVANGLISDRNKVGFKKMPEYRSTLARILKDVTIDLIGDLKAGTRKQQLKQQARALTGFTTTPAVENNFNKLMEKINDSIIRKTQKELRDDFNKTLKPFIELPKAIENRKRTVDGQAHLLLYYANQYKSLSDEKYNQELSNIQSELEKYRDSDQSSEQILFNELEIREQAIVAFGGIDRADSKLSDIDDANRYAKAVVEDGKALTERLDQAHKEKYKPISEDYLNSIEQAKPYVEKKDQKALINQMSQMNVRGQIEFITSYGTPDQKASIEKILLANDASKIKKIQMIEQYNDMLIEEAKKLGIDDLVELQRELSKEKESNRKYSHEKRTALSDADLMTIHMAFRQPDIVERALRTNDSGEFTNPDLKRRYDMKDDIARDLGTQNIALAELMGDIIDRILPQVNETYRKQFGVDLKVQPVNYFPLKVQVKKGGFKMYMSGIASAPSFTIARTHNTNDLDERSNIFEVFAGHISDASHYVTTYESSMGIRSVMTNRFAREAIRQTYGDPTLKDIDDSIVDMVADRPVQSSENRKEIDLIRSWMSNISIGFNPKSVLVALTGTVNAFAVRKGVISSVTSAMRNPQEAMDDIKFIYNSIVVQQRKEQGINEAMQNARQQAKGSKAMKLYTDMAYWGLTSMDSWIASIMGGVIYNQYKNSEQAQGLTPEQVEANGLAVVNRFIQESYQPTSNDFLPADIRRGGSFDKSFFQFLTEPKSKLGIYLKDVRNIKAKYKQGDTNGAVRDAIRLAIGQHILIPTAYWMAGELMRWVTGGDDDEGALNRLASAIILGPGSGLLVWGTGIEILVQLAVGDKVFYGSSIPSDRIMQEVGFLYRKTTSDEEFLEKVDDVLERYIPVYKQTKKAID